MSKIRAFIGTPVIDLPSLKEWSGNLKKESFSGKIKWNDPDLWHLTFKFIGDIQVTDLKRLNEALCKALDGFKAGEMRFRGTGYFGSPKVPKVIWAGICYDDWLDEAKSRIEEGVRVLDLPREERAFHPHLTLGRVKYLKNPDTLTRILKQKEAFEWGVFRVNRILVYQSRLTSNGPVYSEMKSIYLK